MSKQAFAFDISCWGEIELDDALVELMLTDDWQMDFGCTYDEALAYLSFWLVCKGAKLSQIDGFSNFSDDAAKVNCNSGDWEIDVRTAKSE